MVALVSADRGAGSGEAEGSLAPTASAARYELERSTRRRPSRAIAVGCELERASGRRPSRRDLLKSRSLAARC